MVINHYHGMISETATVTSKSMVNIPAKIRKKYSIKEGTKIVFIENEEGRLEMLPVPRLSESVRSRS